MKVQNKYYNRITRDNFYLYLTQATGRAGLQCARRLRHAGAAVPDVPGHHDRHNPDPMQAVRLSLQL